jgi:hypothetical protein
VDITEQKGEYVSVSDKINYLETHSEENKTGDKCKRQKSILTGHQPETT